MRIRSSLKTGPVGYVVPRRRHVPSDPHARRADPMRTIAIGALAVLAALACIAFASPVPSVSADAAPALHDGQAGG